MQAAVAVAAVLVAFFEKREKRAWGHCSERSVVTDAERVCELLQFFLLQICGNSLCVVCCVFVRVFVRACARVCVWSGGFI